MNRKFVEFKLFDIVLMVIYLLGMTYIYIGFFFPDPFTLSKFSKNFTDLIQWGIKIGFPLFSFGILYIYYGVRIKKISVANLIVLIISIFLSLILLYVMLVIADKMRGGTEKILKQYHPFLQLSPPKLDTVRINNSQALKVFCLGGSTTEFKGKKKDSLGWPALAEQKLKEGGEFANVQFHNLGRQWYTSLHTLINFQANLRHHNPDVIIVMHSINDLLINADKSYFSHGDFQEDYGHFYGAVNRIISGRGVIEKLFDTVNIWYHEPRETLELYDFPGLAPFKRNLNTLIDLAEKDQTTIVLMTQPSLFKEKMSDAEKSALHMVNVESYGPSHKWSYGTALRGMNSYNEMIRSVSRERGVYLIDLEKVVPKDLQYFRDDVHYSDKALRVIANYVANEFLEQKIIHNPD